MRAGEEIQSVETLQYLDKAHKHPIEISTPTRDELIEWQKISQMDKDSPAASWIWDNSFTEGIKNAVTQKNFESLKYDIGVQAGLSKALGQKPEFVQVSTEGKPLGMMLMAKDYKTHVTEGNSGFVWYLQSAPKDYLKDVLNIERNEFDIKPGAVLLDTAAVKSLEAGRTDVMLHADPAGGEGLLGYYGSQKYTQVAQEIEGKSISNITGVGALGRENDGRYFHQNDTDAHSYLEKNRDKIGQAYEPIATYIPETFTKIDTVLAAAGAIAIEQNSVRDDTSFDTDSIDYNKYLPQSVRSSDVNSSDLSQNSYESEIPNLRSAYDNGLPDSVNTLFEERGWEAPEAGYGDGYDRGME